VGEAIGFFGAALFLRVALYESDSLSDLVQRVKAEYAQALQHHDFGRIAAGSPMPRFVLNPPFNWFPEEMDWNYRGFVPAEREGVSFGLDVRPFPCDVKFPMDWETAEMGLAFFESERLVHGQIGYRVGRTSATVVRKLAYTLRSIVAQLVRDGDVAVMETCKRCEASEVLQ
jgi:hypothetical protein